MVAYLADISGAKVKGVSQAARDILTAVSGLEVCETPDEAADTGVPVRRGRGSDRPARNIGEAAPQ